MTMKEKIEAAIVKLDAILLLDFITEPVREELTNIRAQLEDAKANL